MCALLANLRFDSDVGSFDGDAVRGAYQLLSEGDSRAVKKAFVLTDGYSSNGLALSQVIKH